MRHPSPIEGPEPARRTRILIAGGGYVGLYSAMQLKRLVRSRRAEVILVNPESFMVYQPFLPEAASGSI